MSPLIRITKALADENRLRILAALRGGPLCVCEIVDLLALADSTTSKHLSILRHAGLVQARKEGRWVYYRLANASENGLVRSALGWVVPSAEADSVTTGDAARLEEILRTTRACPVGCGDGSNGSVSRRSR